MDHPLEWVEQVSQPCNGVLMSESPGGCGACPELVPGGGGGTTCLGSCRSLVSSLLLDKTVPRKHLPSGDANLSPLQPGGVTGNIELKSLNTVFFLTVGMGAAV